MLCSLLAYDSAGNVVATLDCVVLPGPDRRPLGLVDFAAHEDAGGEHTDIWRVSGAAGSKVWPEWLGMRAHEFTVELAGPAGRKRIAALVHKTSGHRRERADVERTIAQRITAADGGPADLRDIVGGPDRPVLLDADGRTAQRPEPTPTTLPVLRLGKQP